MTDRRSEGGRTVPRGALAPPGRRIWARLVDLVLGGIVFYPFLWLAFRSAEGGGWSAQTGLLLSVVGLALSATYEVGFVGWAGATPGKRMFGLRVVSETTGASPPSWAESGRRWSPDLAGLLPIVGTVCSIGVVGLSIVWMYSDDKRRSVYDRAAGTVVMTR